MKTLRGKKESLKPVGSLLYVIEINAEPLEVGEALLALWELMMESEVKKRPLHLHFFCALRADSGNAG